MEDFTPNVYDESPDYENIRWSSEYLSKKIKKLIDLDIMYVMEDVIKLSGTNFLFTIPLCAN